MLTNLDVMSHCLEVKKSESDIQRAVFSRNKCSSGPAAQARGKFPVGYVTRVAPFRR